MAIRVPRVIVLSVKFHEKLRRRVVELGLNKAKAARDVGLPESTISSYLSKTQSLPRIDIGYKIALALKVPLSWLADDSQDWPPPSTEMIERLSDEQFMREYFSRYKDRAQRLWHSLQRVENYDLMALAKATVTPPLTLPLPPDIEATGQQLMKMLRDYFTLSELEPAWIAAKFRNDLASDEIPLGELDFYKLIDRVNALRNENFIFQTIVEALYIRSPHASQAESVPERELIRKRLINDIREIQKGKKPTQKRDGLGIPRNRSR